MTTLLTINVTNNAPFTEAFYVFQRPALFTGGGMVYSNSLWSQSLPSYNQSGAIMTVQMSAQPFAGIQQAQGTPQVGQSSGYATATRAIQLANGAGGTPDWTTASVQPLGLSAPVSGVGVQPGAFRVTTPVYQPLALYNLGSSVELNGELVLSSFVVANPASNTDCQPVLTFYVTTGTFTPGSVINFYQSSVSAAVCDFTGGHSTANVTLNADGTWSVRMA
ncbi:MAG: hypothetical protein KA105_05490 [Caulobacter sp.]|nr:hypothetical protein [Caulobacter sp.]